MGKAAKRKGSRYELSVAKTLTKHTNHNWRRTPYSGAGHIAGDVFSTSFHFPWVIECKNREDTNLLKVFKNPNCIAKWLEEKTILIFNDSGTDVIVVPAEYPTFIAPDFGAYVKNSRGEFLCLTMKDFCATINKEWGVEMSHEYSSWCLWKECNMIKELVDAIQNWREAKEWADRNPELMLSSVLTSEEAGKIMSNYFKHEQVLLTINLPEG